MRRVNTLQVGEVRLTVTPDKDTPSKKKKRHTFHILTHTHTFISLLNCPEQNLQEAARSRDLAHRIT